MHGQDAVRLSAALLGLLALIGCVVLIENSRGLGLAVFLLIRLSPMLPGMLLAWSVCQSAGQRRFSVVRFILYVVAPLLIGVLPAVAPLVGRFWFVTRLIPVVVLNGLVNALPLLALLVGMGVIFSFRAQPESAANSGALHDRSVADR